MQQLPSELVASFERRLERARVPQHLRAQYHKWVSFYLYFCHNFGYPATVPTALGPFLTKLANKNHSIDERHHAATAVRLLLRYDPQEPNSYLQLSAPCQPPTAREIGSPLSPTPPAHQPGP